MRRLEREREQAWRREEAWRVRHSEWAESPMEPITRGLPARLRSAFKVVWSNVPLSVRGEVLARWRDEGLRLVVRTVETLERDGVRCAGCFVQAHEDRPDALEFDAGFLEAASDAWVLHVTAHEVAHWVVSILGRTPEYSDLGEAGADSLAGEWGFPKPPLPSNDGDAETGAG
jgi:hypothetical protein